ncbi:MAG: metallophosphoesterase [Nitrososphaerota archaeon]
MKIIAVGDIHSPKFLGIFKESLKGIIDFNDVNLFLLAGDIVLKNNFNEIKNVLLTIREFFKGEIISCFGNEEYESSINEYLKYSDIKWLNDEVYTINLNNTKISIIGSKGSLDRPTYWQRKNIENIHDIYKKRIEKIDLMLENLSSEIKIVLTHYPPTYKTLIGEIERAWPEMGCKQFEKIIEKHQPNLWIHAHAHNSIVHETYIDGTFVVNVSLPARKKVTIIDLSKLKSGRLTSFI